MCVRLSGMDIVYGTAAEWLDSSAAGIAQLAHVAGESILWHEAW